MLRWLPARPGAGLSYPSVMLVLALVAVNALAIARQVGSRPVDRPGVAAPGGGNPLPVLASPGSGSGSPSASGTASPSPSRSRSRLPSPSPLVAGPGGADATGPDRLADSAVEIVDGDRDPGAGAG